MQRSAYNEYGGSSNSTQQHHFARSQRGSHRIARQAVSTIDDDFEVNFFLRKGNAKERGNGSTITHMMKLTLTHMMKLTRTHMMKLTRTHMMKLTLTHMMKLTRTHMMKLTLTHMMKLTLTHMMKLTLTHMMSRLGV